MKKVLSHILTPIYFILFGSSLLFFHVVQVVAYNLFGYNAQQKTIIWLNFCLHNSLLALGTNMKFVIKADLKPNTPYIFVANHQSMNDIPAMILNLGKYKPIFIAKKELGKGVPSISYNMQKGGAVGIDRNNPQQARSAIEQLAKRMQKERVSTTIFPEGTRAKDGVLKKFQVGGLATLIENCPDAVVIPIAIKGSWGLLRYGKYPYSAGESITWTVLPAIDKLNKSPDQLMEEIKLKISEWI